MQCHEEREFTVRLSGEKEKKSLLYKSYLMESNLAIFGVNIPDGLS